MSDARICLFFFVSEEIKYNTTCRCIFPVNKEYQFVCNICILAKNFGNIFFVYEK